MDYTLALALALTLALALALALASWIVFVYKFRHLLLFLLRINKMAENVNDVLNEAGLTVEQDPIESKRQKLLCLVASGQCKEFLGKFYTQETIEKMKPEHVKKYYAIYETAFNARVSENIVKNIVSLASKGMGYLLPIDSTSELSDDLNNDFLVNSELKKFGGILAYTYGPLLAAVSASLITAKHVDMNKNKLSNNIGDDRTNFVGGNCASSEDRENYTSKEGEESGPSGMGKEISRDQSEEKTG